MTVAELFAETGSPVVAATLAVFVSVPAAVVVTVMVTPALVFGSMSGSEHLTVVVPEQLPEGFAVTLCKLTPDGRTSVTVTPVALPGPAFVMPIV